MLRPVVLTGQRLSPGVAYANADHGRRSQGARLAHSIHDSEPAARQMTQFLNGAAVCQHKWHGAAMCRACEQFEGLLLAGCEHLHRRNHPPCNARAGEQAEYEDGDADTNCAGSTISILVQCTPTPPRMGNW
jgi:hypothetical protein